MAIKKILFFIVIIFSFFVINNLIHSIYNLWQKQHLVVKENLELEKEKKKNEKLKDSLVNVKKPQFIEEEARNKLFLAKPGEKIIVMPTEYLQSSNAAEVTPTPDIRPNWEKWRDLFFLGG